LKKKRFFVNFLQQYNSLLFVLLIYKKNRLHIYTAKFLHYQSVIKS